MKKVDSIKELVRIKAIFQMDVKLFSQISPVTDGCIIKSVHTHTLLLIFQVKYVAKDTNMLFEFHTYSPLDAKVF